MKDVSTKYRKEEFVSNMVHRGQKRLAATKDVTTMHRKEEFVSNMEPRLRYAAMKDVPVKLSREEFVGNMGQSNISQAKT